MAEYRPELVAVGCNRVGGILDWAPLCGLAAYGGGNLVAIYDVADARVLGTLPGHTGRVNCVRWVAPVSDPSMKPLEETELVSGGSDGLVLVWKRSRENKFAVSAVLKGHASSVTSVSVLTVGESLWVASCSTDCTVRLWKRTGSTWASFQTLDLFCPKMIEVVALSTLGSSPFPLLAVGGVDCAVHLFALSSHNTFEKMQRLTGHEGWIRSLAFSAPLPSSSADSPALFLASASQDRKIRLWKIAPVTEEQLTQSKQSSTQILANLTEKLQEDDDAVDIAELFARAHPGDKLMTLLLDERREERYLVDLESVLTVHEDWVFSVDWAPPEDGLQKNMQLLSASMDKTLIVWEPDEASGLWIETVRVGEVGGNLLGFYGAKFGPSGTAVLGHGYTSALHLWRKVSVEAWEPQVTPSGHFDEVRDVAWDPRGRYIVSVSKDQTTRLFARWKKDEGGRNRWHELARPQVHGYDMECVTMLHGAEHRLVSGAEEKILRVFDAPRSFLASLRNVSEIEVDASQEQARPLSANVPPLGLSNKPIFSGQDASNATATDLPMPVEEFEHYGAENALEYHAPLELAQPPFEEQLLQRTLWAEIQKLYGHGNELFSVCSNHKGTLLASGCKSKVSAEMAAIRLWDTRTWKSLCAVQVHKSTVTQIEFSHSDQYLLSVSRARSVAVLKITENEPGKDGEAPGAPQIALVARSVPFARMAWTCSWTPDDKYFAVGSRDIKNANIFAFDPNKDGTEAMQVAASAQLKAGVTAIAFVPITAKGGSYVLAVGEESGAMSLWMAVKEDGKLTLSKLRDIEISDAHVDSVRRLTWCPVEQDNGALLLASCSTDFSLRLFSIVL